MLIYEKLSEAVQPVRITCPFFFFTDSIMIKFTSCMKPKHDTAVCSCGKELTHNNTYRCRICKDSFCEQCSLDHFGLVEKDGKVKYKNILKTALWLVRKRFLGY